MAVDRIVKLNIGGTLFETTSMTLLSCPDSFFGSLLSGRLPTTVDDRGALFIDSQSSFNIINRNMYKSGACVCVGSGEYFPPILHYLRTRQIVVPSQMSHDAVLQEAKFYSLDQMVEELKTLSQEEEPKSKNVLQKSGCYVNDEDQKAYVFLDETRIFIVQSSDDDVSALLQAKAAFAVQDIPASWSDDAKCKEDFASFFTNHIGRGYYSQEGAALKITQPSLSGVAASVIALVSDEGSELLVCTGTGDCYFTSFRFKAFT